MKIGDMQFGSTHGKSTTDAILIVRQIQEKFSVKDQRLYYAFVDLEKAFDRVLREVVSGLRLLYANDLVLTAQSEDELQLDWMLRIGLVEKDHL